MTKKLFSLNFHDIAGGDNIDEAIKYFVDAVNMLYEEGRLKDHLTINGKDGNVLKQMKEEGYF